MPRKAYKKGLEKRIFNRTDNPFGANRCWHCGVKLSFEKRKKTHGLGAWHVDHFPIPYRDIETQYCCGVVDSNNEHNMVPSCIPCNIGHQYEKGRWYYCGRAQICFTKECMMKIYWLFSLIIAFFIGFAFHSIFYE